MRQLLQRGCAFAIADFCRKLSKDEKRWPAAVRISCWCVQCFPLFFLPWHIPSIIGRGGHNKAVLAVCVTSQGHKGEVYMNLMKIVLFSSSSFFFPLPWKRGTVKSHCATKTSWCGHVVAAEWGALPSSNFYNCGFTSRPTGYINSIIA